MSGMSSMVWVNLDSRLMYHLGRQRAAHGTDAVKVLTRPCIGTPSSSTLLDTSRHRLADNNPNDAPYLPFGRSACADVAVAQIRRFLCRDLVLGLDACQAILGVCRHGRIVGRLEVDAIEPGRISAEDQLLGRTIGTAEGRK